MVAFLNLHFYLFYDRIMSVLQKGENLVKVLNVTKRTLRKMPPLNLSRSIVNTEAKLYIHDYKKDYAHFDELLKILEITEEELIEMPFPPESAFVSKQKDNLLLTRYQKSCSVTFGDLCMANGIDLRKIL